MKLLKSFTKFNLLNRLGLIQLHHVGIGSEVSNRLGQASIQAVQNTMWAFRLSLQFIFFPYSRLRPTERILVIPEIFGKIKSHETLPWSKQFRIKK